jgi:hypothetical protein
VLHPPLRDGWALMVCGREAARSMLVRDCPEQRDCLCSDPQFFSIKAPLLICFF